MIHALFVVIICKKLNAKTMQLFINFDRSAVVGAQFFFYLFANALAFFRKQQRLPNGIQNVFLLFSEAKQFLIFSS